MGNWWLFDAWEMKFSLFLLTLVGSSSGAVQIGSCMPEETGLIVERRSYECFPPENIENRASRCSVSRSVCGCNEVNTTTTGYWEWIDTFHGPEVWARSGEGGWDCWEYYCSRQENWYAKGTIEPTITTFPCCPNTCNYDVCRYDFESDGSGYVNYYQPPYAWRWGAREVDWGLCWAGQARDGWCWWTPEACCPESPRLCIGHPWEAP